ncbi:MAG: hypothetical protein NUV51_08260, partial [Sulfuricaulis sp.]|nr:hypothetical protein [Sulfuricaulis sp.]
MTVISIPQESHGVRYDSPEGHFYGVGRSWPSVSKIKDVVAKPGLENWRLATDIQYVIEQAAGLYETLSEGQSMTGSVFAESLRRRVGTGRRDIEIASAAAAVGTAVHGYIE